MTTRLLTPDHLDGAARTLTAAFAADPLVTWILGPGERSTVERLRAWAPAVVESGLGLGWTHVIVGDDGGVDGVAVWSPPGRHLFDTPAGEMLPELVDPDWLPVMGAGAARFSAHHPDDAHFYLGWLGVHPERQGRGLGARLLERTLEVCDAEGHVAALESSNPRNVGLYLRHGFEVVAEVVMDEPGPDGHRPMVTPMVRSPR